MSSLSFYSISPSGSLSPSVSLSLIVSFSSCCLFFIVFSLFLFLYLSHSVTFLSFCCFISLSVTLSHFLSLYNFCCLFIFLKVYLYLFLLLLYLCVSSTLFVYLSLTFLPPWLTSITSTEYHIISSQNARKHFQYQNVDPLFDSVLVIQYQYVQ